MSKEDRDFLKDNIRKKVNFSMTAQSRGLEPPPIEKPPHPKAIRIDLIKPGEWKNIHGVSVEKAIAERKSRRHYSEDALNLDELSFLLWATQGMRNEKAIRYNFRTVPSAGCRHALETYIAVFRVKGLLKAIYRYLPVSHQLVEYAEHENLEKLISRAAFSQTFAGESAVTFIWTALPERMEWRYDQASYKVIALDAGHVCQNLYLACEAIGAGTCAIAAYDQEFADHILELDGEKEFAIYMASVGKKS